jgi:hypothetical protein
MGQMMNQQAQIQNQWRGAFGVGPVQPPPMTGPPMMGSGAPGSPYQPYDPNQMMNAHMHHAQQMSRRITTIILIATLGTFALVGAIVALTMFL